MNIPLALLGTGDLAVRWNYTRQGIHKLAGRPDFPTPAAVVNGGRVRIWLLADVEAYERDRSELGNQVAKQRGHYRVWLKDIEPKL